MAICPGRAACPSSFPIKAFSTAAEIQDEGELYPDIDVGSLFCINHGRCFLLDGKLCSSFQHTGRARAVLQVIVPKSRDPHLDYSSQINHFLDL
jgi:hypothetical protein